MEGKEAHTNNKKNAPAETQPLARASNPTTLGKPDAERIVPYPAWKRKDLVKIMRKKQGTTIAWDILREQKRRIFVWRTAFIVAFTVVVIDRLAGKTR